MSAFARLRLVRIVLGGGVLLRAVVWGALAALSVIIGVAAADVLMPLAASTRATLLDLAVLAAISTAASFVWRDRAVVSLQRVALWVEEHFPELDFTLATAVEAGDDTLVATARADHWTAVAFRRAMRGLGPPVASTVVALAVVFTLPVGAVARVRSPHRGDSLDRAPRAERADANRLTPLVARIVPPAYSGERSTIVEEPAEVRALVGSVVTLQGRGNARGIVARRGVDSLVASGENDHWALVVRVDARPTVLRMSDRRFERIVAIAPVSDNPPAVTLAAPLHDSVLRAPTGRIPLAADARDDFGIASAAFEYIVSSGEGETFKFRSGTIGAIRPGRPRASISASLSLESLALNPGDIVHIRAVARDANNVTGPGIGVSETRAIRIARRDEYDSVAVEAAAPSDEDKTVISERMLIMLAEALEKKRTTLERDSVVSESRGIATDQKRLRRTVGELVFSRLGGEPSGEEHTDAESPARAKTMQELLARADSATNRSTDPIDFEGGESPVVAVNKPLLEAYNAMWDASTDLEVGEPGRALPHMRRALAAVERARSAERMYLRGRSPQVVVDVARARLQGKDKGASCTRRALTAGDSITRARAERFLSIVDLAGRAPQAAIDSLLVLRIEALTDAPAFAAALGDATNAMRRGRSADATSALARARRLLAGTPTVRDSLARWGIVP
jgi:hypothetical protein